MKNSSEKYFNDIACKWDNIRSYFFTDSLRKKAVKKANTEPGKIAIDIGAGTGFITEELLKNRLKVTAIDQSDKMLNILKEKYKNIETIKGESENLGLSDNYADYAFANMYLHHVENPLNSIKEVYRILDNNGKIIITDLYEHNYEFLRKEQYDRWLGFKSSDIKNWFETAGFKNIEILCANESCCSDSDCGDQSAKINIFIAYGEKVEG